VIALIVSPDYLSHYLPLSAIGRELLARGAEVVVATGPGLAAQAKADGFEHRLLALGPSSNSGAPERALQERAELAGFLAATRQGAIPTLRYQAEQRVRDLLWEPQGVTERLAHILADVQPDVILADQIAYGATLALRALERPYAALLPGHPTALATRSETFGVPPYFPAALEVSSGELASLRTLCASVADRFAREYAAALARLNPSLVPPANPFAATSPWLTMVNYPAALARRRGLDATVRYIGSCARRGRADARLEREVAGLPRPRIYVALGTFLSAREDVLARIAAAFREEQVSLIVASGTTDPRALRLEGQRHLVRSHLPQADVLPQCDLVVCHGGNNTVTESLEAGVPLLVAPFASDQFAGAADVCRAGVGDVFDPNMAGATEIAGRAAAVLSGHAPARAAAIGNDLRKRPGRSLGAELLVRMARTQPRRGPLLAVRGR
jgi:zeaxanthin glucosyltransferase